MSYNSNLSVAVICSSNMNRSMEAHDFLAKKGFKVSSFGTGEKVKLPGTAIDKPNIYEFGTPYDDIYNDLLAKDKQYYTQNGLLHMLDRNRRIKRCPERFQNCKDTFDIIVTVEERVNDQVIDFMENQEPTLNQPVHLINIDVQDNHEDATIGAFLICDLITMMAQSEDLDNDIDELLHDFEAKRQSAHFICFKQDMGDFELGMQKDYSSIDRFWYSFVTFFQKTLLFARLEVHSIKWKNVKPAPGCAYNPTEIEHIANVLTHGIWIIPAVLGALELVWRAESSTQELVAWVYGGALILLFFVSTIFHGVFYINRHRKLKNVLHRCDRAMIYVFIAGSYFPWLHLAHLAHPVVLRSLQWCVWCLAAMGIIYQQMYHERYKCLETFLYIVMGLGPSLVVIMFGNDFQGMFELKLGGFLYILGICFFKADGIIPCAHAIWHLFVVMAAGVHYFAILKHLFPPYTNIPTD